MSSEIGSGVIDHPRSDYNNKGCRCDRCKASWAERMAEYTQRLQEQPKDPADPRHGTPNFYGNYGCRCDRCTEANRIDKGERRKRKARTR